MTNLQIVKWCAGVFAASALVSVIAFNLAWRLPVPAARPLLHNEPSQSVLDPATARPFVVATKGHHYSITPRFEYHLTGIVVSMSDAMGFTNTTHKNVGDFINTNDFCVVWGSNAETLDLSQFSFTHGDWTCYVSTRSTEAWSQFKMDGLSNNHVLPMTSEIADEFSKIEIGDQIAIDGMLVDYSNDGRPARTTSIVRTDTGNGACEIIFVTGFRFLERNHAQAYRLAHGTQVIAEVSLVCLLLAFFALPFLRREE